MTYDLFIGDRTFSSWSLRGWLMLEKFGLPFNTHLLGLYAGTLQTDLTDLAPARTVPTLRADDGSILTDSLAMAETLVERYPEVPFYPAPPRARALARSIVCEMHAGFADLRDACPMMLAHAWAGFTCPDAVSRDVSRMIDLWHHALAMRTGNGPWLFGEYSLADVFYAPAATRLATYGIAIPDWAQTYVDTVLADPAFRRWRAMGLTRTYDPMPYRMSATETPWPGPAPLPARAIETGTAENDGCIYSGEPVTHLADINGRIVGFCNAFCRDKTVADPAAWPEMVALLDRR